MQAGRCIVTTKLFQPQESISVEVLRRLLLLTSSPKHLKISKLSARSWGPEGEVETRGGEDERATDAERRIEKGQDGFILTGCAISRYTRREAFDSRGKSPSFLIFGTHPVRSHISFHDFHAVHRQIQSSDHGSVHRRSSLRAGARQ